MKNKKYYIIGLILVVIVLLVVYFKLNSVKESTVAENVIKYSYNNGDYYVIKGDYKGQYDIKYLHFNPDEDINTNFRKMGVYSYDEYVEFCKENNILVKYLDKNKNYIIVGYYSEFSANIEARVAGIEVDGSNAKLYMWDKSSGVVADSAGYIITIPVDKSIKSLSVIPVYSEEEYENIKKYGMEFDPNNVTVDKPIIYLYPTLETNITVKLLNDNLITHSYPKYNNEWNVRASSNGDLIDLKTNRKLYALYYESKQNINFSTDDGFVIEGKDTAKFLEEKLEILGLNERESEEFIIYWLPKLENNKYNYIRFATMDEININMPLEINPKPETLIRILMTYKKLDNKIDIKEQKLTKIVRNGYTVVEWGGTEIK